MNKFKGLFNLYKTIPSENIDPYGFIDKDGPWIGGSFALWHFLNKPKWTFDDIDYFVRTPKQADMPLSKQPIKPEKRLRYLPIFDYLATINNVPEEWRLYLPEY